MHCGADVKFEPDKKWPQPLKCTCGWEPYTKRSQQPHGKSTLYCNMCQFYVVPASDDGTCPYHQKYFDSEEGPYPRYDEFNQDGEEL